MILTDGNFIGVRRKRTRPSRRDTASEVVGVLRSGLETARALRWARDARRTPETREARSWPFARRGARSPTRSMARAAWSNIFIDEGFALIR